MDRSMDHLYGPPQLTPSKSSTESRTLLVLQNANRKKIKTSGHELHMPVELIRFLLLFTLGYSGGLGGGESPNFTTNLRPTHLRQDVCCQNINGL